MPPAGVLLDIAGVLHDGERPLPGAIAALQRLRAAGIALRFVTNTSRRSRLATCEQLHGMGFALDAGEIFTAPLAARSYLERHGLRPLLICLPGLTEDFAGMARDEPDAVFLADAGERFDYRILDRAFQLLIDGAPLIAVGRNRYFRQGGELHLDAGAFVAALEYAASCEAVICGKPSAAFFSAALRDIGVAPAQAVMIGDDVEADVLGAEAAGIHGILVQTGKYRAGDEARLAGTRAAVAPDLAAAVEALLA